LISLCAASNSNDGNSVWTTQCGFSTSRLRIIAEMQQPLPKAQPINVAQVFAQALTLH